MTSILRQNSHPATPEDGPKASLAFGIDKQGILAIRVRLDLLPTVVVGFGTGILVHVYLGHGGSVSVSIDEAGGEEEPWGTIPI
jgi:hypothetical protein